jgi:acetyl esterase/lipase
MRNLELPAQLSPCLRIFIASLLDDSTASVTHEIQGLPSAFVITAKNDPLCDEGEAYAHQLMDAA